MLCRSGKGQELLQHFEPMLFKEHNKWNKIVKALQPEEDQEPLNNKKREGAYLPVGTRNEYQNLANDWLRIFHCSMPGYDALPYMVTIMGLHIIIYILNQAREVLKRPSITFVLEIIGPDKNSVHQLATESFRENNRLTQQAVGAYIDQKIASSQWQAAVSNNDIGSISTLFTKDFAWVGVKEIDGKRTIEQIINGFKEDTFRRHQQHLEKVHGTWGGAIGLSSKRNSRNTRYTPKDILLRTLVLCTVSDRMEFQEFLQMLYDKYGFIIGSKQALMYFDAKKAEQDDFSMNEKRLEDRLASQGLLKRLSDACAYVENPFSQEL